MTLNNCIQRPIRNCRKQWYIHFYTNNQKSCISLYNFDIKNPFSILGKLQYSSQVVVDKGVFNVLIHFPIKKTMEFQIKCRNTTKNNIVQLIQNIYKYIYDIEYVTATPTEYVYYEKCKNCNDIQSNFTKINISNSINCNKCVICLNEMNHDVIMLKCNHIFHSKCILDWNIYGNGKTCPVCRKNIFTCIYCNGSQQIKKIGSSVIIPIEHRENHDIRNDTNGLFEIYQYDFEKLVLKSIFMDRTNSRININICV